MATNLEQVRPPFPGVTSITLQRSRNVDSRLEWCGYWWQAATYCRILRFFDWVWGDEKLAPKLICCFAVVVVVVVVDVVDVSTADWPCDAESAALPALDRFPLPIKPKISHFIKTIQFLHLKSTLFFLILMLLGVSLIHCFFFYNHSPVVFYEQHLKCQIIRLEILFAQSTRVTLEKFKQVYYYCAPKQNLTKKKQQTLSNPSSNGTNTFFF